MPKKYQDGKLESRTDVDRPYWFVRVTVPKITAEGIKKVRERHILGFKDEVKFRDAMKLRKAYLEDVNAGRVAAHSEILFSGLVDRYRLARLPQLGAGTAGRYESQIKTHILPIFGSMKLSEIDRPTIEEWLASKDKLSWWSREGLRGVLSSIFSAAVDWGLWTEANPAAGVKIGRKREVREKVLLTPDQLQAVLAAVTERTRLMILTSVVTGLRISEVCGLKWKDLDLEKGTLTVARRWYRGDLDDPKTEASKRVRQLGQLAGDFAAKRGAPEDWVFLGDEGRDPVDERDVLRYELRPLLKRLKIYKSGMGWHAFRRLNVSWRQSVGGATALEAQKAAGHTRVDTTMLYTLVDAERERSQVNAILDKVIGQGATKQ